MSAHRASAGLAAACLAVLALAGCAQPDPLAPLLDPRKVKPVKLGVEFTDDNAKDTLQRIVDRVMSKGRQASDWSGFDLDYTNRMLDDIVSVDGDTGARDYGGQVFGASVDAKARTWTASSSGAENNCWLIRLTGPVADPSVQYGLRTDKSCKASGRGKTTWSSSWPAAPKPSGVTSTVPPSPGATGSVTSTVPPSPGAPVAG